MAKHYIRLNEKSEIIHGFTDDFEQPKETDICITQDGGRQFELNGEVNPSLGFLGSVFIYKFIEGRAISKTTEEIQNEFKNIETTL